MNRLYVLLLGLAACAPANPGAEAEVAAEVRALRQVLLARPAVEARSSAGSAADVAAALAPLRQALEGLTSNQHELQQRQLALTQELQRWSALLVENATGARREETQALTARLQQLEASLQAQDARHREMETLLQGALDRTADRLGAFLQAVGAQLEPEVTPPGVVEPGPARPLESQPPTDGNAPPPPPPKPDDGAPADGARADNERWQRGSMLPWWWAGVGLLGIVVGVVCLRRWQRATASPLRRAAVAGSHASASAPSPTADPDVQEIWAAAAMLGEAVGRLRESSTAGAPASADEPVPALGEGLDDDLIVIDDELLSPSSTSAEGTAGAPTEEPTATRATPVAATCRLRAVDPARSLASVLQILQEDPRVLRRPEPAVRCARDCLEASFRLVPDLSPGERSHLEQRLRDACGSGA